MRLASGPVSQRPQVIAPQAPIPALVTTELPVLLPFQIKAAVIALAAILLVGSGWKVRGWQEGSKDAARLEAEAKHREFMTELANTVSANTEKAIGEIRIENRTITNQVQKEIVEKPVYRDCKLTPGGVLNANQARRGTTSGKLDGKVPESAAAP